MDPLSMIAGPLLGAAVGGIKSAIDKPQYDRELKLAADTQRLSPWTGLQGKAPKAPSVFNDVLQGGMAGLQMAPGIGKMMGGWSGMMKGNDAAKEQ
jgi:hypothetical protein